jgi:hypothetical protein
LLFCFLASETPASPVVVEVVKKLEDIIADLKIGGLETFKFNGTVNFSFEDPISVMNWNCMLMIGGLYEV